jgi:hypothetical protein
MVLSQFGLFILEVYISVMKLTIISCLGIGTELQQVKNGEESRIRMRDAIASTLVE